MKIGDNLITLQSVIRKVQEEKGDNQFYPPHLSKQKMRRNSSEITRLEFEKSDVRNAEQVLAEYAQETSGNKWYEYSLQIRELCGVSFSERRKC